MQDDERAFGLGFVLGLVITTILITFAYSHFHDRFCLTHYTTIDSEHYYWGQDPNGQSHKSYYWQSVKVVPRTTFTPVKEDTCGGN